MSGNFLNYTRVQELYGKKYNLSPRKTYCGLPFGSDYQNPDAGYNMNKGNNSIMGGGMASEWEGKFDK
jgi:hypothetical protein